MPEAHDVPHLPSASKAVSADLTAPWNASSGACHVSKCASYDVCHAGKTEGMGSQSVTDASLVHPADAVTRLRSFVEAENGGTAAAPTMGLAGESSHTCTSTPFPHNT